jgi:acetyl esterase/lipase
MRSVVVENDVVYARAGGQTLALDIYRVERTASPSVVLYLHGGGWAVGDKADGSAERLEALTRVGVTTWARFGRYLRPMVSSSRLTVP